MTAVVSRLLRDPAFRLAPGFILRERPRSACTGKTRFTGSAGAYGGLAQHHNLTSNGARGPVRVYRCWHCHGWHIGSRAL